MAWSHSALDAYNTCPKRYYHVSIKRDFKEDFGAEADYGSKAHKFFEDYLIRGKALPLDLFHHKRFLDQLKNAPGEQFGEQKLGLTADFAPTGFFDSDIWGRAIIDYLKVKGNTAVIVDHKFTKKIKDDTQQLLIFILFTAAYFPEVKKFHAMFYWAKQKKFTAVQHTREDLPALWNGIIPRIRNLEKAQANCEFPPKESGLCKKYCPVTSCPHNGGYR